MFLLEMSYQDYLENFNKFYKVNFMSKVEKHNCLK